MKKCIILANGTPPPKNVFNYLYKVGYETLICADGGANSAVKYELLPDYIIGDLDSIKPETYDYYFDRAKIIQIKRQNDTDVEKCLKFAMKHKFTEVVLLGATGNRLDHSICNLGIVLKFYDTIKISIIHEESILKPYTGTVSLKTFPGETISLYGFDGKTKITSTGLKYKLTDSALHFGKKESTSNVAKGELVTLKIKNGVAFVVRNFNLLKKNGLV
ncbi:MAG: thiamine diphosphokinase [Ignavibacteriales bacterium]|nr:thiamine diphosphokinase [Ignavibacteriales bacterium]